MSRWLFPVKIGFIIGVLVGLVSSWANLRHDFHYSLYSNAANNLASTVLLKIPIVIAIILAVCFLYLFLVWVYKKAHRAVFIAVCLAFLTPSLYYSGIWEWMLDEGKFIWYFICGAFETSLIPVLGASAIVIGGIFLLKKMHTSSTTKEDIITEENQQKPKHSWDEFIDKLWMPAKKIVKPSFRVSVVLILIFVITAAAYRINNYFSVKGKPNVIIIMTDTTRADHIGCYGYKKITPNIDDFASEATRFKRVISQSSLTVYSVPSFLSSRHPFGNDSYGKCMLAEVLRNKGYDTASIISNPQAEWGKEIKSGVNFFDDEMTKIDVSSPGITDKSQKWIEKRTKKPFFLFALYMDPHSPYIKHKEFDYDPNYKGKYPDNIPVSPQDSFPGAKIPCDVGHMKAVYDSDISFTDKFIGKIINYLKEKNLYNNSVVVYLADHGEEFKEHNGLFHGDTLYNEVISVPCIIKLPYQKKSQQIDGTFSLINLYPTILGAIGIDSAAYHPEGRKINLQGLKSVQERFIFSSTSCHGGYLKSVEADGIKLIYTIGNNTRDAIQIFDLKKDQKEKFNLKNKEKTYEDLQLILNTHESDIKSSTSSTEEKPKLTKEEKERLKTLGYLAN